MLGEKTSNKVWPLIITVIQEMTKRKLFSQLYKLRENEKFKHIGINHDMTKEEKKVTKERVEEAKRRTDDLKNNETLNMDEKTGNFWSEDLHGTRK